MLQRHCLWLPVIQMLWCLRDYQWLKGCKVTVCNCQWCVVYDALACDRKRDDINVRCWPRCICYNVTLLYSPVTQTLNQRTSVCHWYKLYDAIVHVCQQRKCNDVTACLPVTQISRRQLLGLHQRCSFYNATTCDVEEEEEVSPRVNPCVCQWRRCHDATACVCE